MKLMVTLNVKKFVDENNLYAKSFDMGKLTVETVYKALDDIHGVTNYIISKPHYVALTAGEIEKFTEMLDVDGWKEIALDNSSRVWFMR